MLSVSLVDSWVVVSDYNRLHLTYVLCDSALGGSCLDAPGSMCFFAL